MLTAHGKSASNSTVTAQGKRHFQTAAAVDGIKCSVMDLNHKNILKRICRAVAATQLLANAEAASIDG